MPVDKPASPKRRRTRPMGAQRRQSSLDPDKLTTGYDYGEILNAILDEESGPTGLDLNSTRIDRHPSSQISVQGKREIKRSVRVGRVP